MNHKSINSWERDNKLYSVVIPVYKSALFVEDTVIKTRKFFLENNFRFELILINDGSPDDSWSVIKKLAMKFDDVVSINLLKNYGQHHANLCGFRASKGDYLITMDDDLQNPPAEIKKLILCIEKGFDLVIGKFDSKKHHLFRRVGSKIITIINRKVFSVEEYLELTNFRIVRRDVVDRVCKDKSFIPYIPGLLLKFSCNRSNVIVKHDIRVHGESNYSFRKILQLVMVLLFNHSNIPLRYSAVFGFLISSVSFILSFFFIVSTFFSPSQIPGWASLAILISFFNGVLILLMSVVGEYLVRILRELDSRDCYEIIEVVRS